MGVSAYEAGGYNVEGNILGLETPNGLKAIFYKITTQLWSLHGR